MYKFRPAFSTAPKTPFCGPSEQVSPGSASGKDLPPRVLSHFCAPGRTQSYEHAELGSLRGEQVRPPWPGISASVLALPHRPGGQLPPLVARMSGIPPLVIL